MLATRGKDNTVGSTRTAAVSNSTFTEELVGHYRTPTQSVLRFSLHHGTLPLNNFTLTTYTEEMRAMSICGGTATYVSMTATYCTDKVVNAYDFYNTFRSDAVGAVAKELNALEFVGTCPVGMLWSTMSILQLISHQVENDNWTSVTHESTRSVSQFWGYMDPFLLLTTSTYNFYLESTLRTGSVTSKFNKRRLSHFWWSFTNPKVWLEKTSFCSSICSPGADWVTPLHF